MKKLLLTLAMIATVLTGKAQYEVGTLSLQPKIGVMVNNLTNCKYYTPSIDGDYKTEKTKYTAGGMIGLELEYQFAPKVSVAAALHYSLCGAGFSDYRAEVGGVYAGIKDSGVELWYLNVPIVVNYYVAKRFALKVGIQPEFCTSAKQKITSYNNTTGREVSTTEETKIDKKTFGLSIPVGASYAFGDKWVLDFRYNIGLTKVFNTEIDNVKDAKNSVFMLTFGYKFKI